MLDFAFRNLLLFFKDRTAVLLSFLAEFIVIGLYILFIRDNLISNFKSIENIELLIDIWMVSGILGITSVSTTMGVYGIMIEDKNKKIIRDFTISPISNVSLLGGYMTAACAIGIFLTFLFFAVSEIYIFCCYGVRPGADRISSIYSILFLTTLSNSALTLLLVSFLKTSNALAACCTILGTLIGFLTGIYLPMGNLPQSVQILVKCFPVSHCVVLFRQALMEPFISENFGGINTSAALEFMKFMGIQYTINEDVLSGKISIFILFLSTFLCTIIAARKISGDN